MLTPKHKLKIFYPIVQPIAVAVVNDAIARNGAEMLFPFPSVFGYHFVVAENPPIPEADATCAVRTFVVGVAVPAPPPVVHLAPASFCGGLRTIGDRALHGTNFTLTEEHCQ